MKSNILILGTNNFNNSLKEIKEYLNFSLIFYNKRRFPDLSTIIINLVLVDNEISIDSNILKIINELKNKPFLLLKKENISSVIEFESDGLITPPLRIEEMSENIKNLITIKKFNANSSLKIKEYLLDKNERKLRKENLSITVTEREIQLIELLYDAKKSLTKNFILKTIWKYSEDTDTHTVETHIYRLRKKIFSKFKDENFITNSITGYVI